MIAAIYARKSTEQNGVADEAKSCTRQVEHARAYAARKGWTVADEHVPDDELAAMSAAERKARPEQPEGGLMIKERKRRRARGSGSVYRKHGIWWISYLGPDGQRHAESSESRRKGDAERLLERRVGARENNLPVIPRAERLTFHEAAQAVINDFKANGKRSLRVAQRRIGKACFPTSADAGWPASRRPT